MIIVNIPPWKIYCDNIATLQAYNQIERGGAERCDCDYCLNFLKVRDEVYPETVKDFFSQLGIDYKKEPEVYYLSKRKLGWHIYGGWFHFIGTVERVEENKHPHDPRFMEVIEVEENFSWSFSNGSVHPYREVFNNQSLSEINFDVHVSWVINTKEPEK
jgi:hypothetical protein